MVSEFFFFLHSDITVSFADHKVKAHKFVLAARGDHWSSRDLNEISELQLTGIFVSTCPFVCTYNIYFSNKRCVTDWSIKS